MHTSLRRLPALVLLVSASAAAGAEVQSFTPDGEAKSVRQVRARFSEPMVPMGDPRAAAPFSFECAPARQGTGRWADDRNWVLDFDRELPGGTSCVFRAVAAVAGKTEFRFTTGDVAITASQPYEGSTITEDAAFILALDGELAPREAAARAYLLVEGLGERIPMEPVTGATAEEAIKAVGKWWYRTELNDGGRPPMALLKAKRALPPGAKVTLVWPRATGDQRRSYRVQEPFTARFECERENADAPCIPFLAMRLELSAPVPRSKLGAVRIRSGAQEWKPEPPGRGQEDDPVQHLRFKGPFPESSRFTLEVPRSLKDEVGRPLANAASFPLSVQTGRFPPLAKFAAGFGVVELGPEAAVPVTVRNIEPELKGAVGAAVAVKSARMDAIAVPQLAAWLARVEKQGGYDGRAASILPRSSGADGLEVRELKLPRPNGAQSFEVMGIPVSKPGFYVLELQSRVLGNALLGADRPMYVSTAALVTNLAVHFKRGRESSLAWVTRLDTAEPVPGAAVELRDCSGKSLAAAATDANGIARLPKPLKSEDRDCSPKDEYSPYYRGLFVTARKGDDFTFAHTTWNRGIESWRYRMREPSWNGPVIARTVLDRPLFRAGETVRMKHFLRRHTAAGVELAPASELPKKAFVRHSGSSQEFELALKWSADQTAESQWTIPKDSKLGEYAVRMSGTTAAEFRVEEYRVPLMKAALKLPSEPAVAPRSVDADLSVEYLAGGPAAGIPAVVRWRRRAEARPLEAPRFDEYVFANGPVPEKPEADSGPSAEATGRKQVSLDRGGGARVSIDGLKPPARPETLLVEAEYRDPNGAAQTAASELTLLPGDRLPGFRPVESSVTVKDGVRLRVAAVTPAGEPAPGTELEIIAFERRTLSHRKRLVGGFYAYEHRNETRKLGRVCSLKADAEGKGECRFSPPSGGNFQLQVQARDSAGRIAAANGSVWVYDREQAWFEPEDNDRIDLIPDQKRYEPSETARFQVRMPFPSATALVTVEREGVIDGWVARLSGSKPELEVPVLGRYAPNVFVSALVLRGRDAAARPTALVDLGRPSYKLGMAEIAVGWKAHELKVTVTPDKATYQTRAKARVRVQVAPAVFGPLPKGAEVAVAVVDEGLLQLKPNDSWKLLEGMMAARGLEVETFTAQSQVVGRRHFGLKAQPTGGDGGRAPTRELFDTLLYWKGRVPLDRSGSAEIEVPLNDSLTSFRIVAVAHAGAAMFGTGSARIRSTSDLMLLTGIPPFARTGDRLSAEVTVRNTAAREMELTVKGSAYPSVDPELPARALKLPPGGSATLAWPVELRAGSEEPVAYAFEAMEKGGTARDRARIIQKVGPAVPTRVLQATLEQLGAAAFAVPVQRPADALPESGGVKAALSPSLLAGLGGVTDYMSAYPYDCLEQRVSKAVALADTKAWQGILKDLPTYLAGDGLVRYFPTDRLEGSATLTSYVVAIASEAAWEIPEALRGRMLDGLARFVAGSGFAGGGREPGERLTFRKLQALDALSRHGKADWKQAESLLITPALWPTSALLDWRGTVARATGVTDREKRLAELDMLLRARLAFQGTSMTLSNEAKDWLSWLMADPDASAARLVLVASDDPAWKDDAGRIARGAISRQRKGHWGTTPANAWGRLALERFAARFEKASVAGKTVGALAAAETAHDWSSKDGARGGTLSWPWPAAAKGELTLKHEGSGAPWATVSVSAAVPLKEPLETGYRVRKTLTAVERARSDGWSRGDVVRVRLDIEALGDLDWVVVSDPIPAGASILGTGLGGDGSMLDGRKDEGSGPWAAYEERGFEGFRAYYDFVPRGKFAVEYTMRLNQAGRMGLPPTRVEAMYSPEAFGELPNAAMEIKGAEAR